MGSRDNGEDIRSKSAVDIRQNGAGAGEQSPPTSAFRRRWNSFKSRTRRFRSSSREKLNKKQREESKSQSRSDVSASESPSPSPLNVHVPFDGVLENKRQEGAKNEGTGLVQYPHSSLPQLRGEERESEVDSGIGVGENSMQPTELSIVTQRHHSLRSHAFLVMELVLKEGRDLVVRDSCGTSDPYVKFKVGGKQHYKSRTVYKNLNPRWDERFQLPIEDPFDTIQVKVMDYDRGKNDDSMGSAEIDPASMDINKPTELKLLLSEKGAKQKDKYMGYLLLTALLVPKTQVEKEQILKKNAKQGDAGGKKLKTQTWSSVVTVVLVSGSNLLAMDDNGFSDPYVKFRLGNEKYKSKWKSKSLNPEWREQFDLYMYDDQTSHLEITVWDHDTADSDDVMGRAVLNLSGLQKEASHAMDVALEDGAGFIKLVVSISGTTAIDSISSLNNYVYNPREREEIIRKYGLVNSVKDIKDVGWLQVKVIKAQGLASADIGGKSDPFCVLEIVNDRLQTHTEYKTLCPEWGKVFTFNVKDIHAILDVTVYDEDSDKKVEFLGKVSIPLLRIQNRKRRWYQLKDKKTRGVAKGAVLLELDLIYNHVKAAIRTVNPREEKYMQPEPKFKISVLKRNKDRVSNIIDEIVGVGNFIQSCFNWESKPRSIAAFIIFLIVTWIFELYMIPLTLLLVFMKELLEVQIVGNLLKDRDDNVYVEEEDDEEEDVQEKEEKTSIKQKLQQINDICLRVQQVLDTIGSLGERVKNTFNWTVPWLSWLAVVLLFLGTLILYFIPLRYLVMAWGINKFTKKLRKPNAISNNELLDYLSRIPSNEELINYQELRPDSNIGTMKKKRA